MPLTASLRLHVEDYVHSRASFHVLTKVYTKDGSLCYRIGGIMSEDSMRSKFGGIIHNIIVMTSSVS